MASLADSFRGTGDIFLSPSSPWMATTQPSTEPARRAGNLVHGTCQTETGAASLGSRQARRGLIGDKFPIFHKTGNNRYTEARRGSPDNKADVVTRGCPGDQRMAHTAPQQPLVALSQTPQPIFYPPEPSKLGLAVASPSSLARLYFFRHAIFQPSGLALSLMFYGTDVSISGGPFAILRLLRRSWGKVQAVRWVGDDWGMGSEGRQLGMPEPVGMCDTGPRELGGTGERAKPHSILAGGVVRGAETPLCEGKTILNNSSVSQEGEKPLGYGIAAALNYTVGG